ncbi:hypothetical protein AHAS_Ahas11G0294200 [Arachis hypogaea]
MFNYYYYHPSQDLKDHPYLYQVHASIIQQGLEQDHLIISRFIFLSISFTATALYYTAVFNRVLTHTKGSYFFDTLSDFIRMKAHGSLFDRYTYPSVIKACSSMSKSWERKLLHGSALRCGRGEGLEGVGEVADGGGR